MNDLDNTLSVMKLLIEALTVPRSMDEGLNHITRMTCELMNTRQSVFLFRDEERKDLVVRSTCGMNLPLGSYLQLPERLKNLLWRQVGQHQMNWMKNGTEGIFFPILVSPVEVKGVRVGLLVTGGQKEDDGTVPDPSAPVRPFAHVRQKIFSLLTDFSSRVIENAKMYDLLRQRFAIKPETMSKVVEGEGGKSSNQGDAAAQLTVASLNNPTKVVKILAESFYKELIRAGFQPVHVASAAAQLLENVVHS